MEQWEIHCNCQIIIPCVSAKFLLQEYEELELSRILMKPRILATLRRIRWELYKHICKATHNVATRMYELRIELLFQAFWPNLQTSLLDIRQYKGHISCIYDRSSNGD